MSFVGPAAGRPRGVAVSPDKNDRQSMANMASHKRRAKKGKKVLWQLYSLQPLVPAQFVHIVNGILAGHFGLIGLPRKRESDRTNNK